MTLPEDGSLRSRVAALEEQLAELQRSDRLIAASFRHPGTVEYLDADGNVILFIGGLTTAGVKTSGMQLKSADGTTMFEFTDSDVGWILRMFDESGNEVVATDATNEGLARPYLPLPFCRDIGSEQMTTTSAVFQNRWRLDAQLQHPRVRVRVYYQSIGGAIGEVRLWDETDGVPLGDVLAVPNGAFSSHAFEADVPAGSFGEWHDLRVQARRTNGVGSIGTEVVSAYGIQS